MIGEDEYKALFAFTGNTVMNSKEFLHEYSVVAEFCLADNVYQSSILDWLFGFDPNCQVRNMILSVCQNYRPALRSETGSQL
jgi:hypothetical protein